MAIEYVANTNEPAGVLSIFQQPSANSINGPPLRLPGKADLFIGTATVGQCALCVAGTACKSIYTTGLTHCLAVAVLYRKADKVSHIFLCHIGDYRKLRLSTDPQPQGRRVFVGTSRQPQTPVSADMPQETAGQIQAMGDELQRFAQGFMPDAACRWGVVASTSGRGEAITRGVEALTRWVPNPDQIWTYRNEKLSMMNFAVDIEGHIGETWQ